MYSVPSIPLIPGAKPVAARKKTSPKKIDSSPKKIDSSPKKIDSSAKKIDSSAGAKVPGQKAAKAPGQKAAKVTVKSAAKPAGSRAGGKRAKSGVESVRQLSQALPPLDRGHSEGCPALDPDQEKALELRHQKALLLSAGPGAGKTFTLNQIAGQLKKDDAGYKILVLMFNVAAEEQFLARLEAQGCQALPRQSYNPYEGAAGVLCCTFDKFAATVLRANRIDARSGGFYESKAKALQALEANPLPPGCVDYLIIDEAQDVAKEYVSFCQHLLPRVGHYVLAGDPRQELYEGAGWFSTQWASAPPEQKVTLRYNHRSDGAIVALLNEFSALHFPTLHHDQISTRPRTPGAVVFHEHAGDLDLIDMLEEGFRSAGFSEVYAIVPVTVQKFNLGPVTEAVVNRLGKRGLQANLLDGNFEGKNEGKFYAIGTCLKLKGTERRKVLSFAHHLPYHTYGVSENKWIKSTFVALSRAQDQLHIFLPSKPLPPIAPMAALREGARRADSEGEAEPPALIIPPLSVSDHMASCSLIEVAEAGRQPIPSLTLPDPLGGGKAALHYPAFNGVLVETALALQLGCPTEYWESVFRQGKGLNYFEVSKKAGTGGKLEAGLFRVDSKEAGLRPPCPKIAEVLVTRDKAPAYIEAYLSGETLGREVTRDEVSRTSESPESQESLTQAEELEAKRRRFDKIYALSAIKITSKIGEWWRATETWKENVGEAVMEYSRETSSLFDITPAWNERVGGRIGQLFLWGETDFILQAPAELEAEAQNAVVEVKFAAHNPEHLRQAGIYAALIGADRAFVLNAREGSLIRLEKIPSLRRVVMSALTVEALRIGYGVNARRLEKTDFWGNRLIISLERSCVFPGSVESGKNTLPLERSCVSPVEAGKISTPAGVSLYCGSSAESVFPGEDGSETFEAWLQKLAPYKLISLEEAFSYHAEWCRLNGWAEKKSPLLGIISSCMSPECEISLGKFSYQLGEICPAPYLKVLHGLLFLAASVNWAGAL